MPRFILLHIFLLSPYASTESKQIKNETNESKRTTIIVLIFMRILIQSNNWPSTYNGLCTLSFIIKVKFYLDHGKNHN